MVSFPSFILPGSPLPWWSHLPWGSSPRDYGGAGWLPLRVLASGKGVSLQKPTTQSISSSVKGHQGGKKASGTVHLDRAGSERKGPPGKPPHLPLVRGSLPGAGSNLSPTLNPAHTR